MPNRRWNHMPSKGGGKNDLGGGKIPKWNEKTAAWPAVPGKTQPRDRSGGTKKVKQSMKSEGI